MRQLGKVLIVDDEPAIRRTLHITLHGLGFDIGEAGTGEEALALTRILRYDAVLLDVNMPGRGGIEACRDLRQSFPHLAIVMLSVCDSQDDKVEALEAGADDYITKPFQMRELIARIRAALRRVQSHAGGSDPVIRAGGIELDPARRLVRKRDTPVHLTPKEFDLLQCLMTNAGVPVAHSRLLSAVWGPEYRNELEYLRTFIHQLRKKLEDDATCPQYLLTDAHIGYRFREPD